MADFDAADEAKLGSAGPEAAGAAAIPAIHEPGLEMSTNPVPAVGQDPGQAAGAAKVRFEALPDQNEADTSQPVAEPSRSSRRRPSTSITPLDEILAKRLTDAQLAKVRNTKLREFYGRQNELIDAYQDVIAMIDPRITSATSKAPGEAEDNDFWVTYLVNLSFLINLTLATAKIFAAIVSGSLTVIASALDSILDLLSAFILWLTRRSMLRYNPYKYPQGRNRLEPAGVMVFAVIMGMGSLQLMIQAVTALTAGLEDSDDRPDLNIDGLTIGILGSVIVLKLFLWISSRIVSARAGNSPALDALGDDHRNDVVTNCVGLAAAVIANEIASLWWLDPAGAIFFSVLIIVAWVATGREQLHFIVGGTADNTLLSKLTYLAAASDVRIRRVDTIIAYHFGVNFLVQCDIVLPPDMPLQEAHDIGDALERRMERLDEVERAFVHLDWEWVHSPEHSKPSKKEV